jgi:CRP-like cAMP-binding protein
MNRKIVLAGNLTFLPLGDLLQLLSTDNRSGTLRISNPHFTEPGLIFIKNGNPVDAVSGKKTGIEALYSLFGWLSGDFEFILEEVQRIDILKKRMMAIVLDALRVLDEGGIEKYSDNLDGENIESDIVGKSLSCIKGPFVEYSSVVDEDEYTDGSSIVIEGRHGNWLWVVLEGLVDIIKNTKHGKTVISTAGVGAFIGGLTTILHLENTRSASAIANGTVQLGVIDTQQLSSELSLIDPEFKNILLSLDKRLRKISNRYAEIVSEGKIIDGPPLNIKTMIKQGDDVQKVFKILNGEAFIVKKINNDVIKLMTLEKGDFIGNIPFLNIDHEPLSASVFVSEDLKLGILDIDKLIEEYNKLSVTVKNIIEYTTVCISATTSKVCA